MEEVGQQVGLSLLSFVGTALTGVAMRRLFSRPMLTAKSDDQQHVRSEELQENRDVQVSDAQPREVVEAEDKHADVPPAAANHEKEHETRAKEAIQQEQDHNPSETAVTRKSLRRTRRAELEDKEAIKMLIESVDLEEEEKVSQTPRASKRVKSTRRKAKESEKRAATPDGTDDQPLEEEQEEQEQAPRSCQLLDRSLDGLTKEKHRLALLACSTVTVKTLRNVLCGRLLTPMGESREELVEEYLSSMHPDKEAADSKKRKSRPVASDSQEELVAPRSARKRRLAASSPHSVRARTPSKTPAKTPREKKAKVSPPATRLTEGEEVELDKCRFRIDEELATGADSIVYRGTCVGGRHEGRAVAIKMQPRQRKTIFQITTEHHVLTKLKQKRIASLHIQEPLAYGCHEDRCYILVTGMLGPNMLSLLPASKRMPARQVLLLAYQGLGLLEELHAAMYVHRDIKLHLIDFGTAEALVDLAGRRRLQAQAAEGTPAYMATTVHKKEPLSKRDDVEALLWTLLRLYLGELPWERLGGKQQGEVLRMKSKCLEDVGAGGGLEGNMREFFEKLAEMIAELKGPEGEPDYNKMKKLAARTWSKEMPKKGPSIDKASWI
ncbi:hypothetical protein GUITHDRAFT_122480 [Guillardia theta CCMP2712]|uniref:Protein kinase domain-containing protein n=1 Tax=Guillardia theta (strain CCMP2712) TaxID=905079 RepID=L1I630_GUITC|nr:hypothetical protein GUITHDRAFT_122480 [Guillardia theta CCMP2712]EKX31324.1 hypothetical protein GUITHDRAFT_122480 [Guillardia theta CCMP2712]|eukprot:XP_005818304.1 hypothetical protein GUITHDRAFT_122480 [Guillardia theta CCMP2712]